MLGPDPSGPEYVNGVAEVTSPFTAEALMAVLHKVETMLGRSRGPERWAARACDLDLITHGAMVTPGLVAWRAASEGPPEAIRESLILPHPQAHRRAFVLLPLAELAPEWRHPVLRMTAQQLFDALPEADRRTVRRL